jgi:phosphoenolpyruvate phosphomutase
MTDLVNSASPGATERPANWLFGAGEPRFLMEAHDGLSAIVARHAGFAGLWASGLGISTSLGYRDSNETSWSVVADVVERMVHASELPVLVDGDTGFGNFNNARIFAKTLSRRGAGGVCFEDKRFPKLNSFAGDNHSLAEVGEFCGRLRAVKDAAGDLLVVARTETLIAGAGMDEALDRAHAYAEAGADAVLIHSRRSEASEVLEFAGRWGNRLPVVVVPTKYYATPVSQYRDAGIATVIWANQSLRASISAMRRTCLQIFQRQSIADVEQDVASLDELFQLLNYDELAVAERRYVPG